MKIAQVTTVFPPFKGGMGQVPYHYAAQLHRLGQRVEVLTPDYGREKVRTDFTIHYLKPWLRWGLGAFCPQIIFRLKSYDIVQLHYPAYGLAVPVWLWRKFLNGRQKKLFVFYHMDNLAAGWLGVVFRVYRKLFLKLILSSADRILVSSLDYARHSQLRGWLAQRPENFYELPFGVTANYFPDRPDYRCLDQFSISSTKKIILFVGGLGREHYFKGLDYLLTACSFLPQSDWHLVCVGRGELIDKYKKQAVELKINEQVTFTDYQPDEAMPNWYRLAAVTVLPSIDRSEAFGLVLIEAQACGSPVVATDLPGVRTTLVDGQTGYISKLKNSQDLAKKISRIIFDPGRQSAFSQAAVKRAQKKYQWSEIVKQLLALYYS